MDGWVLRNGQHYARFNYRDILATCFASGGALDAHYSPLRNESRSKVLNSILSRALPESELLYGANTGSSFNQVLGRLWNDFVDIAGLPAEYRAKVNESAYQLMRRIGVPKSIADAAIKHLPDLVGDTVSKFTIPALGLVVKAAVRRGLKHILTKPS